MEFNQQFGRYLVIKPLGSGATSDVYLAHDTTLKRDVALKVLKPALVSDPDSFSRFTVEAQAASKLFHDYIATVLDMGDMDGRYYIAMRYVEGMSLDAYLRKNGPLSWENVKKLAQQIGSALSHAHSQGYLHRDIKPNNIMVSSKGDFVLTDFGLTRAMFESGMTSTTGAILGTPAYIPPEIWNGKTASPLSDQYSFACVIDEAITGHALFSGDTPQAIITKHLVNQPEIPVFPVGVPENVRFVIQKALSKNSAQRFPDMQAFVNALLDPGVFDAAAYLKQIDSREQSDADKKRLEILKAKKQRKTITSVIGIATVCLILSCVTGFFVFRNRLPVIGLPPTDTASVQAQAGVQPTSTSPVAPATQIPTSVPTQTVSATLADTSTATPAPTSTATPAPTDTATTAVEGQVALGSGVEIKTLDKGPTGLIIYLYDGEGNPIQNQGVSIYTQQQDLSGNWVTKDRSGGGYTDNTGSVKIDLPAGQYIVKTDFAGYNWGSASDVSGQANVPVEDGKQTQLILRLARLKVGFVFADGSVVSNQGVGVYTQKQDISGHWVTKDRVGGGYTDNTGDVEVDLTAGNYLIKADFNGYNWGDAYDVNGESNVPLQPGQVQTIIVHLGRMIVALKDAGGNPVGNKGVGVHFQKKDVNGNPSSGDSVTSGYTDNTGSVSFDLTPGSYAITIDNNYYYNIQIEAGKITTTDGNTQSTGN
jgi:serine/threonine protein kinase